MVNKNKLRGRVVEVFGTVEAFAKEMSWSTTTQAARMRGEGWKQSEITKAAEILFLRTCDIADYFFADNVEVS